MSEQLDNRKNEVALRRFAAVSFVEQKVREGLGVVAALRLAALKPLARRKGPVLGGAHPGGSLVRLEKGRLCGPAAQKPA